MPPGPLRAAPEKTRRGRHVSYNVLEPTRGENVLDIVLSSQKELVDNVNIHEPLGKSEHNQIHFDINVK